MITRSVDIDAKWDCINTGGYLSKPHLVKVAIKDTYNNTPSEDLSEWVQRVANEVTEMMCKRSCGSLSDSVFCNDIFPKIGTSKEYGKSLDQLRVEIEEYNKEQEQIRLKNQQKKEKEDKKKKAKLEKLQKEAEKRPKPEPQIIPVTIDEEPTTITIKKELTTMDVIQISRLAKSISKLEKQKEEQQKYLNIPLAAIERIEESGKLELMLGQIVTRDRWLDEINRTNRKIEKQNEAIEKIKLGG